MTYEMMDYVENMFSARMKSAGFKPGSAKYKNAMADFFTGAMAAAVAAIPADLPEDEKRKLEGEAMPPKWIFGIMRGENFVTEKN